MTLPLNGRVVAEKIVQNFPQAVALCDAACLWVQSDAIPQVAQFLRDTLGLEFDYLANLTATDNWDYFEVVYNLVSLKHNHSITLRCQLPGRADLSLPSVVGVWRGADLQEREVYDLMGIRFTGHPNLKRLLTWEGFPGHPLRKDWV